MGGVGVAPSAIEPPSSPDARAVVSNDSVEGDVPIGKDAGRADDVEDVLAVLRRAGLLETSERSEFVWAGRADVERPAMRLGRLLLVLWVVAALAAAGGWFGWQHWLRVRREQAATLRDRAASAALAGDHADLIAAERWLREARELDPHAEHGARWMLVVHAQRALEDGAFEAGFLRPSLSRAERAGVAEPLRLAARAVVAVADADPTGAARHVEAAVAAAGNDPWVLYVAGRLGQRIGVPGSVDRIAQAAEREPRLSAAAIALAEARADEGQRDEALASIANVLNHHRGHLRASLWKAFLEADEAEPRTVHDALDAIARRIADHGAPTDRVLAELVRARLARREGQLDVATEAIDRAARAGASEPRLLALVASEARAVGRLSVARAAASAAVQNAPAIAEFRKLLAEILLDERDGTRALRVLGSLSMDDPDVLRLSARAALVVGAAEPIQAAAEALTRWLADHPSDATVELRSLRVRALVDLGRVSEVLQEARTLAREAPGDPDALRALGEAALAVRDARLASETLARLVSSLPDDPDAHFLHGRALRLSADADGAERALRRALELAPGHVPARLALGRLLLDRGKWAEADAVYVELTRSGARTASGPAAVAGRLGRVEALIGLGRLDDAEVQMGAVREQDRDTVSARLVVAALALARRRPGEAVAALRDVAAAHTATADVVAAYGDALYEAGETDAAAAAYDRALELDGTLPEALLGRARIAVRAERPRDAYRYLDEAEAALRSRIRPPRLRATLLTLRGRAALLEGRARRELARSALRAAVQLDGVPAEAHFFLGEALSADNSPEARAAYEAYLAREPDGPFAARARRAIEVRP
ncbi:MAG: tetratricopeptide repeat protein [Myxococcota bacterium]|nr:tetratricopeptide repeat protein [Myxococcota bacterium]